MARLGPCFVKIGQTLAQRPDLVGEEACEELKLLQTENAPFDSALARLIIAQELGWTGPLAPGLPGINGSTTTTGQPLFRSITPEPIASASLGQVYRAQLHSGQEVAVKVQRPEAVRQIALDWTCLSLALAGLTWYWRVGRPSGFDVDLTQIADEIAGGVFQELDYRQEARNAARFAKSLDFLGFVDTPRALPELTTASVLTSEWVRGRHLRDLRPDEAASMTTMAVEACTASLVLTGELCVRAPTPQGKGKGRDRQDTEAGHGGKKGRARGL